MTKARDLANFVSTENELTILDKIIHSGDTNTAIRFPAADTVTIETDGVERFRVSSTGGRVGLGVTNPAVRFQVAALSSSSQTIIAATETNYLANFRASQLAYFPVDTTGTTFGFSNSNLGALSFLNTTNVVIGTNGNTPMAFATTSVERMRITGAGNVGIGTSSPSTRLHVSGDTTFGGATIETVFALSGTTPALDPTNGTIQTWTLSGNSSPTDSLVAGEAMTLMIDDGSAFTITWPSVTWKTNSGAAPTLNTTGFTAVQLWKVGTTLYGARVGDA